MHGLPPGARGSTAVLTANYGEAGAVDRFGPALGLPAAYSVQDGYWYWGPPPAGDRTLVVVGLSGSRLRRLFTSCRTVGRLDNGLGVEDQEQGTSVRICTGRRTGWGHAWTQWRADLG